MTASTAPAEEVCWATLRQDEPFEGVAQFGVVKWTTHLLSLLCPSFCQELAMVTADVCLICGVHAQLVALQPFLSLGFLDGLALLDSPLQII